MAIYDHAQCFILKQKTGHFIQKKSFDADSKKFPRNISYGEALT